MIDVLVARDLVSSRRDAADRRRVVLSPTELGRSSTLAAREAAQSRLAERLSLLPAQDLTTVFEALNALGSIFSTDPKIETKERKRYANPGN